KLKEGCGRVAPRGVTSTPSTASYRSARCARGDRAAAKPSRTALLLSKRVARQWQNLRLAPLGTWPPLARHKSFAANGEKGLTKKRGSGSVQRVRGTI